MDVCASTSSINLYPDLHLGCLNAHFGRHPLDTRCPPDCWWLYKTSYTCKAPPFKQSSKSLFCSDVSYCTCSFLCLSLVLSWSLFLLMFIILVLIMINHQLSFFTAPHQWFVTDIQPISSKPGVASNSANYTSTSM